METKKFKMLYDRNCPFCFREVLWLQKRDQKKILEFEDISQADFNPENYGLTHEQVNYYLHGIMPDGTVVTGLEVTRQAFGAIGLGWLVAFTKWPLLKHISDFGYHLFAKYRVPLGKLFGRHCAPCSVSPMPKKSQLSQQI